jgi:hypothetical protein
LITRNATSAPKTSKHITIPATAPPPSFECLPWPLAWLSLLSVLLGTAGGLISGGVFVDGGGGGAGPSLNEFPLIL